MARMNGLECTKEGQCMQGTQISAAEIVSKPLGLYLAKQRKITKVRMV